MKFFFWMGMLLTATGLVSCGGSAVQEKETPADSQMVAEHVDPSTRFPQQLVETHTLQDEAQFEANALQSAEETIALANLAIRKTTKPEVKTIAQNILQEHQQLYRDFQKLPHHGAGDTTRKFTDGRREELEKLNGTDFNRQWVEKMVTWNAAIISRYETAAGALKDKGTKELVNKALPILKIHQQQLETCRTKLQ
ncbi:DUF4142 domain-containing protein [Paraflavitalea soli]|nr:DUF4142 domain-containing protein [Paraflavitalea soli]